MTKREKLIQKFLHNPMSLSDAELIKILQIHWFTSRQGKGSHTVWSKGNCIFPTPDGHSKPMKKKYSLKLKKLLYPDDTAE